MDARIHGLIDVVENPMNAGSKRASIWFDEESRKSSTFIHTGDTIDVANGEIRCPDGISVELWNIVRNMANEKHSDSKDHGRNLQKQIFEFANQVQPPAGFYDEKLWKALPVHLKDKFLAAESQFRGNDSRFSSQVLKFVCDINSDDFNFDSAVSAFALLNALLLTIPYGTISVFTQSAWDDLITVYDECADDSYFKTNALPASGLSVEDYVITYGFDTVVTHLSCGVYGSIVGLIYCTLFYVFKPPDPSQIEKCMKVKQRALVGIIFVCTIAAITGEMCGWCDLLNVFCTPTKFLCNPPDTSPFTMNGPIGRSVFCGVLSIIVGSILAFYLVS